MSDEQHAYRALVEALRALRDAASSEADDPKERTRAAQAFLAAAQKLASYVEDR